MFFGGLPAMAGENLRGIEMLTANAADLLPVEVPWRGTPSSPLVLLETPTRRPPLRFFAGGCQRHALPLAPRPMGEGDHEVVGEGGGKTVMAQIFLGMMARANPLISILERGGSYRPLVELTGGRIIEVNLEGTETLNPWDRPGRSGPARPCPTLLRGRVIH